MHFQVWSTDFLHKPDHSYGLSKSLELSQFISENVFKQLVLDCSD